MEPHPVLGAVRILWPNIKSRRPGNGGIGDSVVGRLTKSRVASLSQGKSGDSTSFYAPLKCELMKTLRAAEKLQWFSGSMGSTAHCGGVYIHMKYFISLFCCTEMLCHILNEVIFTH